jgi:hypothetical protein
MNYFIAHGINIILEGIIGLLIITMEEYQTMSTIGR